jgi:hypothetical protein
MGIPMLCYLGLIVWSPSNSAKSLVAATSLIRREVGYTYTYTGRNFTAFRGKAGANMPTSEDRIILSLTLRNTLSLTGGDKGSGIYSFDTNDPRVIEWKISAGRNELTKESLPKNGRFQTCLCLDSNSQPCSWSFYVDNDDPGGLHFYSADSVDSDAWSVGGQSGGWATGPENGPTSASVCDRIEQQLQSRSDRQEARHLSLMLLGALFELSVYRDRFIKEPSFKNLFVAEYYNSTREDLRKLANWDFNYPIEKMEQMLAIFDAFKANRIGWPHAAEEHWKIYYDQAREQDKQILLDSNPVKNAPFLNSVDSLVDLAVTARVSYDLPRALKYSFDHRFHASAFTTPGEVESLRVDFLKCEQTLDRARTDTEDDIRTAAKSNSAWFSWFQRYFQPYFEGKDSLPIFENTAEVRARRVEAWREAFDTGAIRMPESSQPVSNREQLEAEGEVESGPMSERILTSPQLTASN